MNTPFDDEQMKQMLEPFERDHDRLRTELMASLSAEKLDAPRASRNIPIMKRRLIRIGITAAAAAVVIAFLNLRSSHKSDGIAWADVVNRMNQAKTLIVSGTRGSRKHKTYMKDPHLMRMEEYGGSATQPAERSASQPAEKDAPDHIEIQPSPETGWRSVGWETSTKYVGRQRSDGCPPWRGQKVASLWAALRRISSDDARRVGESPIEGETAVVFEAPLLAYIRAYTEEMGQKLPEMSSALQPQGTIRIYVSKKTAAPIRAEVRDPESAGGGIREESNLQWDVSIDDTLFQIPSFDKSWNIEDRRSACFSNKALKAGNVLHLGPPDGPAIVTEQDVESIQSGTELTISGQRQLVTAEVHVNLSPEANKRLAEYTRTHIGGKLIETFNGKQLFEDSIRGEQQNFFLNITSLGVTLEEFEQKYLAPKPPDSAPAPK